MADFSWVKPAGEGLANLFGLNPEEKAKGALIQEQRNTESLRGKHIQGEIDLLPAKGDELKARTEGHRAGAALKGSQKTKIDRDLEARDRASAAIAKMLIRDPKTGTISIDPNGLSDFVREFPHFKLDTKAFAEGLGALNLQTPDVAPGGAPGAPANAPAAGAPAKPATIAGTLGAGQAGPAKTSMTAGDITPPPAAGAPLDLSGIDPASLSVGNANLAPGLTTVDDVIRKNNFDALVSSVTPPSNVIDLKPEGMTQQDLKTLLSAPPSNDQAQIDEIRRVKLMKGGQAGAATKPNAVFSQEGANNLADRNLADKIALANAEPFTLGQGQQRFNAQGQVVGENGIPLEVSAGSSLMTPKGAVVGTAPGGRPAAAGAGTGGSRGTGKGTEEEGATTLDVNRSNEWIARAKEVVAEWSGATEGNPITPGVASQLAAHAYREYFGQGMPNRNADEVMREYLHKSGFKFDNTAGNWNPFSDDRTEVTTKDGKVITGGADSALPVIPLPGAAAGKPGGAKTGRLANGQNLMPSPVPAGQPGSSPDTPHVLGVSFTSDPSDSSILPGMFFRAENVLDGKYYVFQRQADGTNVAVEDATRYFQVDRRLSELKNAGFTAFGSDMSKSKRFKEGGVEKVYQPFEAVDVRHLLAPSTGLAGGVSNWNWVNKVGTFSEIGNMLRYIGTAETGIEGHAGMRDSPTVKAYYLAKDKPEKQVQILQEWLNNRVAPVREWHQKELEARTAKPATVASTLSDTK